MIQFEKQIKIPFILNQAMQSNKIAIYYWNQKIVSFSHKHQNS